ncbi:Uncharacterized protein DBV15_06840 [Temnothorax longispinosus]|uniref:Chitin-binding type-2 domain-containing protein n=1 Tax=Temnothorax longispinosus TaxID=300112 RepID=A0A4V3S680_9HYME|nr:Uncharacterized protein DBV15_06840 [Temnothorax longispinosus]
MKDNIKFNGLGTTGKYLIAIAFLACWTVITASKVPDIFKIENDQCPPVDTCPPKLISHETDCAKYYECKYGQRQLRSCAANLFFSKKWSGCVDRGISDCPRQEEQCPPKQLRFCAAGLFFSKRWRGCVSWEISDCVVTPSPTPPTPTPPPPTPPTPPTPPPVGECRHGDLLPHECVCTKFYECKYGRKAVRDCPVGQRFNPSTKTCEVGDCNTTPPPPPPVCQEGEFLPHECQCNKYYQCKNGRKALRECDQGWHFDNSTRRCIPGNCNNPKPRCVNGDAKKHECGCDKYYKCNNDEWLLEHCAEGLHFSETKKICMNPLDAGCDKNVKPKPGDCPSSSPSKWAHECDCRLYYQCESGKKKLYDCSWGNYFNIANLKCDVASKNYVENL